MEYTKEQLALKAHIDAQNEKDKQEAEAEGRSLLSTMVSDPEHWAGYDVYTIDQYEHLSAQGKHTDLFKEIEGTKPRWMPYEDMTTQEINDQIERLEKLMKEKMKTPAEIKEDQNKVMEKIKESGKEAGNYAFANLRNDMGM